MSLKAVAVFWGLWWLSVEKPCEAGLRSQDCDNGKVKLETDLPQSDELSCPEPWLQSTQRLTDLPTKYSLKPAEHICMNITIKYNHTIPNSGAHRPVGALSGEYLYCPPQRWLNNLKDGAIVLLYHPCVSEDARNGLAAMAHSCLNHYVLTAHPQLSQHRPFALVSWGYTLEMSHVTSASVCDWLLAASSNLNQTKESQRPKYSLYLTKAAPVDRVLGTAVKSLRACCVEAFSAYEKNAAKTRSSREAHQSNKGDEAVLSQNKPSQNGSESKVQNSTHTQSLNITEDEEVPPESPHGGHVTSFPLTTLAEKTKEKTTTADRMTMKVLSAGHIKEDIAIKTVVKSPETGVMSHKNTKLVHKHRIKTDTEEQGGGRGGCGVPGQCTAPNTAAPKQSGPLRGLRMPTARTDEAVWAAAALGFLLVLLTLSVLHTRLYRNWRTPPSLYWRETQQDYESVADIIRRRLRMAGRRKRRTSQSRRQECPLLPDSSTDNESD